MALDEKDHRLFIGFGLPPALTVYDTNTGMVVANVNISSGADDLSFDPNSNLIFASCSSGYLNVVKQANTDAYFSLASLPTGPLARTALFSPGRMNCSSQSPNIVATPHSCLLSQ